MSGKYVCFEGMDCSGKDQQLQMLGVRMRGRGRSIAEHSDPDESTPIGQLIRRFLSTSDHEGAKKSLLPLYTAHSIYLEPKRRSQLKAGHDILQSRINVLSGMVYQQEDWDRDVIRMANTCITLFPDLTIILDLPVEETSRRLASRTGEPIEVYEKSTSLEERRQRYLWYSGRVLNQHYFSVGLCPMASEGEEPTVLVVDGLGTPEEVHERVWAVVLPRLG